MRGGVTSLGTRSSRLRFTDEQTDDDTGLVYLRARWYDSATGRFTTRDPFPGFAALPQTLNPYVYVLNNPINLTDHSGEFADTIFDIFMVGLDVYFLLSDGLYYLQHPCADASERGRVLGGDLLALAADALLMVVPFAPGGAGLANKGLLILTRVGYQIAPLIRVGQVTAKGVQVGTYLARASGRGGGTGGSVGAGGQSSYRSVQDAQREIEKWNVSENLFQSSERDLDAARRELLGEQFPGKPRGHIRKVNSARQGLQKALDRIQGALRSSNWSGEARQFLIEQQTVISKRLDRIRDVLGY